MPSPVRAKESEPGDFQLRKMIYACQYPILGIYHMTFGGFREKIGLPEKKTNSDIRIMQTDRIDVPAAIWIRKCPVGPDPDSQDLAM